MISPRKFLLLMTLLFLGLGFVLEMTGVVLSGEITQMIGGSQPAPAGELQFPRYLWTTGRLPDAIAAYQELLGHTDQATAQRAQTELVQLIYFENSARGKLLALAAYMTWAYPPRLYALAILFGTVTLLLTGWMHLRKPAVLAILPFQNYSDLKIGDEFPQVAAAKIQEIVWQSQRIPNESQFLSETLDLPVFGMLQEGPAVDTLALVETALQFTVGVSDLPLSRLVSSLKLWFQQPRYLVRGFIHGGQAHYSVHVMLLEGQSGKFITAWHTNLASNRTDDFPMGVVDALIFPLLFHFGKNMQARRWQSFQAMTEGMQCFLDHQSQPEAVLSLDQARQHLEKCLETDPEYDLARFNLALILLMLGNYEEAREQFHTLAENSTDLQLRRLASYNYGVALFHLTQDWAYEKAAALFETLLQGEPEDRFTPMIQSSLAVTYAKMAGRRGSGQTDFLQKARAYADRVLNHPAAPQYATANAYAALGYAFLETNEVAQAVACLEQAAERDPKNVSHLLGLAEGYLRCQERSKALAICQKAASQSTHSEYPQYRVGNIFLQLEDMDRAKEAFQKGPHLPVAQLALGKIELAEMRYSDALEAFRTAVGLNKKLAEAWVNIAWTILEMENTTLYDEALQAARRALQVEKNPAQLWHRHAVLARCLLALQRYENAFKEAQAAMACKPTKTGARAQALYYLAQAQAHLSMKEQAAETLQQLLALAPGSDWHIQASHLLARIDHPLGESA